MINAKCVDIINIKIHIHTHIYKKIVLDPFNKEYYFSQNKKKARSYQAYII